MLPPFVKHDYFCDNYRKYVSGYNESSLASVVTHLPCCCSEELHSKPLRSASFQADLHN